MLIEDFPDPSLATSERIIALGGDLRPERLLKAYRRGIFPWPIQGMPLAWFCPPERAILEYKHLHISKSLRRAKNNCPFHFTLNRCFNEVILRCAETPRPDQDGTWITQGVIQAYQNLHTLGHAHSVEAWQNQTLVGGIYGVEVDGIFSAESMFHLESNASKLAILYLMDHLHSKNLEWIDIQVMTPHMEKLGARLISREEFLVQLKQTQDSKKILFPR